MCEGVRFQHMHIGGRKPHPLKGGRASSGEAALSPSVPARAGEGEGNKRYCGYHLDGDSFLGISPALNPVSLSFGEGHDDEKSASPIIG